MNLRRLSIAVLGTLGVGVLLLMAFLAYKQGSGLEAAGWLAAGFLALREVISKIENVALNIRQHPGAADNGEPECPGLAPSSPPLAGAGMLATRIIPCLRVIQKHLGQISGNSHAHERLCCAPVSSTEPTASE